MIDRRSAIRFVVATAVAAGLSGTAARAQQGFQRFIPLLVDLPGWTGAKPDGMSMEMPGHSMTTATRDYERGDAHLGAQIILGPAAEGALAATNAPMRIETSEARIYTTTIDGLRVAVNFTVADKSGAVIVALAPSALFTLTFRGVAEDEAVTLAKAFNWKALQAALPK